MEKEKQKSKELPEDATTVGMFLKYTRLNQKKMLEKVANDLCIRKIYLIAIEESNFKELPPVPYGIGFVRSYAEYLGLNSERIVQCYKEEALPSKTQNNNTPIVTKHSSLTIPNRRQILIGVISVLCLYLVWLTASCKEKTPIADEDLVVIEISDNTSSIENIPEQVSDNSGSDEKVEPEQIFIVEKNYEPEIVTPKNEIIVKFKGDSWFELKDSEKVYITGTFHKGFEYTVPDVSGLIFSVGRYDNVEVYINGKLTQVARPRKQTNISLDKFRHH